jgi:hypothetical protein
MTEAAELNGMTVAMHYSPQCLVVTPDGTFVPFSSPTWTGRGAGRVVFREIQG